MSADLSVTDVLERAADLIEPEGKWTKGELARDELGQPLDSVADIISGKAKCFCAWGAITHVFGGYPHGSPEASALCKAVGTLNIGEWNDEPERTQAEVVAKLREAAALAREQGK